MILYGRGSERSETAVSPPLPSPHRCLYPTTSPASVHRPQGMGNIIIIIIINSRGTGIFDRGSPIFGLSSAETAVDSFKSTATHGSDATDVRRAERVFSSSSSPPLYPETAAAMQLGSRGACIVFRNEYYYIIYRVSRRVISLCPQSFRYT